MHNKMVFSSVLYMQVRGMLREGDFSDWQIVVCHAIAICFCTLVRMEWKNRHFSKKAILLNKISRWMHFGAWLINYMTYSEVSINTYLIWMRAQEIHFNDNNMQGKVVIVPGWETYLVSWEIRVIILYLLSSFFDLHI